MYLTSHEGFACHVRSAAWSSSDNFTSAGFTEPEAVTEVDMNKAPPAQGIAGAIQKLQRSFERAQGDPFYAVIAYRGYKPVYE